MSGNMWASPDSFCPVYQGLHVAVSVFINFLEDAWVARRDTATEEYNSFFRRATREIRLAVYKIVFSNTVRPHTRTLKSVRLGRGAAENASSMSGTGRNEVSQGVPRTSESTNPQTGIHISPFNNYLLLARKQLGT